MAADIMVPLQRSRIGAALAVAIAVLVLASLASDVLYHFYGYDYQQGMRTLISVDYERNVPTGFQVIQLLAATTLLAIIAAAPAAPEARDHFYWYGLALIFLFATFDEAFQVHETLNTPTSRIVGNTGPFYHAWVLPAAAAALVVGFCFLNFLRRLVAETRWRFIVAGACYLGGAVLLEFLNGWYASAIDLDFVYALLVTLEEALEMIGISLFILALIREAARRDVTVVFR